MDAFGLVIPEDFLKADQPPFGPTIKGDEVWLGAKNEVHWARTTSPLSAINVVGVH